MLSALTLKINNLAMACIDFFWKKVTLCYENKHNFQMTERAETQDCDLFHSS